MSKKTITAFRTKEFDTILEKYTIYKNNDELVKERPQDHAQILVSIVIGLAEEIESLKLKVNNSVNKYKNKEYPHIDYHPNCITFEDFTEYAEFLLNNDYDTVIVPLKLKHLVVRFLLTKLEARQNMNCLKGLFDAKMKHYRNQAIKKGYEYE